MLVGLSFLGLVNSGFAADLKVSATLSAAKALPGIPVGLTIVVANAGAPSEWFHPVFAYEISSPSSPPFLAQSSYGDSFHVPRNVAHEDVVHLAKNERRMYEFPVTADVSGAGLFCDARMMTPGLYRIRVGVERASSSGGNGRGPSWREELGPNLVWSPSVELEVQGPEGDDAEALQLVQAMSANAARPFSACEWGVSSNIVDRLARALPDSTYTAATAALVRLDPEMQARGLKHAVVDAQLPPDLRVALRLALARLHVQQGADPTLPATTRVAFLQLGRREASEILATTSVNDYREDAQRFVAEADRLLTDVSRKNR